MIPTLFKPLQLYCRIRSELIIQCCENNRVDTGGCYVET